ncbi:MAG: hypothetical protein WKF43_02390 [Acidimicrobiales bacterium]
MAPTSRRRFLAGSTATAALISGGVRAAVARSSRTEGPTGADDPFTLIPFLAPVAPTLDRAWIGAGWWGNRFCDWRLRSGRIESVTRAGVGGLRTLALLVAGVPTGPGPVFLSVRTGVVAPGAGFSGLLLGAGGGLLHPRAAALVQRASGLGGGFLCCYEPDGAVRFREHTNEARPADLGVLPATTLIAPVRPRSSGEDVELRVAIEPAAGGLVDVTLTAIDTTTRQVLAAAIRRGVARREVTGGISLADLARGSTARHWFGDLRGGGAGLVRQPYRAFGPIAGALYTLSGTVLKMTVQLMPIGLSEPREVLLQVRSPAGSWATVAQSEADAQGPLTCG